MIFCLPVVPQSGTGGGKRFRNSASAPKRCEATTGQAEYQNRKIFISVIEKIFCAGAIKIMFRKFFCFARRNPATKCGINSAEAGGNVGRDYSKSACGFCSKKVRTSSRKHRQVSLSAILEGVASALRASALYFSAIFQGIFKSKASVRSAMRKFAVQSTGKTKFCSQSFWFPP